MDELGSSMDVLSCQYSMRSALTEQAVRDFLATDILSSQVEQ